MVSLQIGMNGLQLSSLVRRGDRVLELRHGQYARRYDVVKFVPLPPGPQILLSLFEISTRGGHVTLPPVHLGLPFRDDLGKRPFDSTARQSVVLTLLRPPSKRPHEPDDTAE